MFWELSERMPDNAIIAADSGTAANWYARHLRFRSNVRGSLSGTLATMGPAVRYVIGAKWAHPDRPGIAFEGDGAMQMNGLAEMITVAKYWISSQRSFLHGRVCFGEEALVPAHHLQ